MNAHDLDIGSGARVVVAMSGGVDSSLVAALCRDAGLEVVGVTLQLYDHGAAAGRPGTCCAGRDIHDARRVADHLGIAHYVLDYETRFRDGVIEDFADAYAAGTTPVPCVRCNQRVKFRDLMQVARDLGADALATGHYVRRIQGADGPELHRGADAARDQSYFLFATTPAQLDFLRFPLGALAKAETRALAHRHALPVADKPDSQDLCFVPDGDYARVVARLRPDAAEPGPIELADGTVIGAHEGVIHYTVGQRRGLGVAWPEPLYVLRLEPARRAVIVGPEAALGARRLTVADATWLDRSPFEGAGAGAVVKLRASHGGAPARVRALDDSRAGIVFDEPQKAIAPGQAAVVYRGSRVMGGGWIERAQAPAAAAGARLDTAPASP